MQRFVIALVIGALFSSASAWAQGETAGELERATEAMIEARSLRGAIFMGVRFLVLAQDEDFGAIDRFIRCTPEVRQELARRETAVILDRLDLDAPFRISVVGFKLIMGDAVTMLFVSTTEQGPVAVKLSYFVHENQLYMGRVQIADDWDDIEALVDSVDRLPAPFNISTNASYDPGRSEVEDDEVPDAED